MTLKIETLDEQKSLVFRLTGRIQAEQIPELQALLSSQASDKLILDLKEVKLVDRDAVRFLAQSETEGARLRNCSAFIRQWISQERNEMERAEAQHQQL